MPKTPFQFKISTTKPTVFITANPLLEKTFSKFLRKRGLSIKQNGPIDYVLDNYGSEEAIKMAINNQAKYLLLQNKEQPLLNLNHFEKLNWRIVKTDFLAGPGDYTHQTIKKLIEAAINNDPIPVPEEKILYPIYIDDLLEAIWKAFVLPETNRKEFLVLGEKINNKDLADFVAKIGQTSKGINHPYKVIPDQYQEKDILFSRQKLLWSPTVGWQETIEKTFHYFWKIKNYQKRFFWPEREKSLINYKDFAIEKEKENDSKESGQDFPKKETLLHPQNQPPKTTKSQQEERFVVVEKAFEIDNPPEEDEEKIKKIVTQFENNQNKERIGFAFSFKKLTLFLLLILLGNIIASWLKPIINLGIGAIYLKKSLTSLQIQNFTEAKKYAESSFKNFDASDTFLKNSKRGAFIFGIRETLITFSEIGKKASLSLKIASPLAEDWLSITETTLKNKPKNFNTEQQLEKIKKNQTELISQISFLEALINSSAYRLPEKIKIFLKKTSKELAIARSALTSLQKITPYLPWFTGEGNQRRTYLILFQNNMELRPTGGFIGSFGLLTFEDGKLINFEVKDIYSADGQLKGHVEPPKQIKEILGEESWYLRDANWNPDFPASARNIEWFLKKELGREVDGVIGINLEAAKKLVAAFGEIYLSDFNEKITADNLFERGEFWSENHFFPGSNQKEAFLSLLGKQLFETIKSARSSEYLKIFYAFLEGLEEKEILVFLHNNEAMKTLSSLNWDGKIKTISCKLKNCFSDYLFLVEANLGINKANYFIQRSLEQTIEINEDGKILHQLKINYENTATSANWPGGNYTNWLRIFLPKETQLEEIKISDPLNNNYEALDPEKTDQEIKLDKEIIGFKVIVPIKQRRTVEIKFRQKAIFEQGKFNYLLYWQKQSGFRSTPISLLISFPDHWQPTQVNPIAEVVNRKLLFNEILKKDLYFGIQFEN